MDRRSFVTQLGLLSLAGACARAAGGRPSASLAARRPRLLVFTKSSGFVHSVVKPRAGAPSLVDRTLTALGARDGFDVTCTRDGGVFTPEGLRGYDAFFFFTSGVLTERGGGATGDGEPPMPAGGKQALLDAVASGKGFVGIHATTDSFHTPPDPADRSNRYVAHGAASDPYLRMLGGEFIAHGKQQQGTVRVADARFPGMQGFADGTRRMGEWYSLKDFAPDLHVLMVLDTAGMEGLEYQRGPYPVTWARKHGKGRVLYSALGHREEEWEDPAFVGLLSGSLRWAFGQADADVAPNLAAVAPRYAEIPPRRGA
jgi:hypothetical protein